MRELFRTLLLSAPLTLGLGVIGCSSQVDETSAVTGPDDEIVDVINSRVKNQSIGNCWLYATVGWVEAMNLRATGTELNLSESYLTYWDWYEKIVAAKNATLENIATGGFFTSAGRLMNTYGLVDEGVFLPDEATMDRSDAQGRAEAAINASLKTGSLRTDRSAANVRAELNKAFGLKPEVITGMNQVFGAAAPQSISSVTFPASFKVRRAKDLDVAQKRPGQPQRTVKLSDEIARWREAAAPTDAAALRGYLRRVQKALHDGNPVLIVWNVNWASRDRVAGSFPKMMPGAKIDGVHMTLLEDYQASFVPNFGLLPAGVTVTDTKILDAALSSQVEINFFRIKNSWGASGDPSGTGNFKGYVDLYSQYLFPSEKGTPKGIVSFVLPSDYETSVPTGIAKDLCDNTKVATDGDYCAKSLGAASSDTRLFSCDTGMSATVRTCEKACLPGAAGKDACGEPPPPNPCEKAVSAGKYCGVALGIPSTDPTSTRLFSCQKDPTGTWISPFVECAKGCTLVTNQSDRCKR